MSRLKIDRWFCAKCEDSRYDTALCTGECEAEVPATNQLIALSNELMEVEQLMLQQGGESLVDLSGGMECSDYSGRHTTLRRAIANLTPRFLKSVQNS